MKQMLTRELLEELYTKQKLSIKKIVELTNNSTGSVRRKIEEYDLVKVLTKEEKIKQKGEIVISAKDIKELYINQNLSIETIAKRYGVSKNKIKNLLKIYQVTQRTTDEKFALIHKRSRETLKKKYGVEHPYQISEIKNKMIRKVQAAYATGEPQRKLSEVWANQNIISKVIKTKLAKGNYNRSEEQEIVKDLLVTYFGENDVEVEYAQHPHYKWPADFYIKSLDLLIEYQGYWAHGKHPFDPNNIEDQKKVARLKIKGTDHTLYAIKIWTQRDPEKRAIVKKYHINWKEFFTIEEVKDWLNTL